MTDKNQKPCPTCQGKKVIDGRCECSMEWRGTKQDDQWEDCQCSPEQPCPTCQGRGQVDAL
ncbi:MAG: ankyrin [Desulfobulbaceae bacterium]|nr:ankyrin [Desulfobulbaceae bacterium]